MKKLIILSTLAAGLLIAGIVACTFSHEAKETNRISPDMREAIERVGILHNQGLDTILTDLWKEKVRLFKESVAHAPAKGYAAAPPAPAGFSETYDFTSLVHSTTKRVVKNWYPELNGEQFERIMSSPQIARYLRLGNFRSEIDESDGLEELTPFQQDYFNRLKAILYTEGITVDRFKTEVLVLEKQIEREAPTVEEAEQLLCATSVARHSAEYWAQNAGKWATVLNSEIQAIHEYEGTILRAGLLRSATQVDSIACECNEMIPGDILSKPTGYYPHPYCPQLFFYTFVDEFWNNIRYTFCLECEEGLYFNPEINDCDCPEHSLSSDWGRFAGYDAVGAVAGALTGAKFGATGAGTVLGAVGGAILKSYGEIN